jgi:hypothetical protein
MVAEIAKADKRKMLLELYDAAPAHDCLLDIDDHDFKFVDKIQYIKNKPGLNEVLAQGFKSVRPPP